MTAADPRPGGPTVCGEPASVRLMQSVENRYRGPFSDGARPTKAAVVLVLRALADHTALTQAISYRQEPEAPNWSPALCVGRWLHDTADQLEDR